MKNILDKTYDPGQAEDKIYSFWLEKNYFHAEPNPAKKPYTIVIPPPNITGQLHMGHALDNTLQDVLIRWRRMQGCEALWLPGTDHASIATEAKIVEDMRKENLTKEGIGREAFLRRAWEWKEKYGSKIIEQLKRLGSSCDWERTRFTLDEGCSKAVQEVFARLYEKGLIYRGERIINWCPECGTSISEAEIEYEEKDGFFWNIRYPLTDGSGFIEIATTRPETMLGDTAVAVHPEDERYKHLVGKTVTIPVVGREIPIIADSYVDMEFGTGALKITPAHDPNDFEIGLRHKLPVINVIDDKAVINENGGKFAGLERYAARKAIVKELEEIGALAGMKEHAHNVGTCYRCSTVVEPKVSTQWFVKMEPQAKPAIEAVKSGKTVFIPERFDKIYFHWMENIRDWCISRQLWWGHRIPAYYCGKCGEITVSKETVALCPKCGSKNVTQDPDTLDTWFSSALWPFSTLGWPEETPELDYFYPTNTLVTGYDIIFFWVARMIFSGCEQMGETPFDTVLIHGLVRDALGRKMSKSLGNGIDPLEVIDSYGADALRFTLVTGNSPGNDMRFSDEKVTASRNFANKLWNAARFVLMNLPEDFKFAGLPEDLTLEDKWVLSKLNTLIGEVTENLERFELGVASQKVYEFIWDVFCDWYIELAKIRLNQDENSANDARNVLVFALSNALKLLHPFMPFITEEIWQALPVDGESIMVSPWPVADAKLDFGQEEAAFEKIMGLIKTIRNVRAQMNVPPSKKTSVFIETDYTDTFKAGIPYITRLAFASSVEVGKAFDIPEAVFAVTDSARALIPMEELVDKQAEIARLTKEIDQCGREIESFEKKLGNESFVAKAPKAVVDAERAKLENARQKLMMLKESIAALGGQI